ncbi:hypothetical protein ACTMU2_14420 [Cupriavidus basilensis]
MAQITPTARMQEVMTRKMLANIPRPPPSGGERVPDNAAEDQLEERHGLIARSISRILDFPY